MIIKSQKVVVVLQHNHLTDHLVFSSGLFMTSNGSQSNSGSGGSSSKSDSEEETLLKPTQKLSGDATEQQLCEVSVVTSYKFWCLFNFIILFLDAQDQPNQPPSTCSQVQSFKDSKRRLGGLS